MIEGGKLGSVAAICNNRNAHEAVVPANAISTHASSN